MNKNAPGAADPALLLLVPGQGRIGASEACLEIRFGSGPSRVGPPEDGLKVACTEVPGVGTTSEQGLQHPTHRPPGYPAVTSQSLWVQLTSPASPLLA